VVNYDGFDILEDLVPEYAAMVKELTERYYRRVTRYTTSAFMRMKLGEALERRGVAAHIYERV
jgi:propionate CoA-transferase